MTGKVLDVGGVKNSTKPYKQLFSGYTHWETLNMNPNFEPDIVADINKPLSIQSDTYDGIICMNTLEHIFDIDSALNEIIRIMKPDAVAYISVPFLFEIHADPDDFNRFTASWWKEKLSISGIPGHTIQITSLSWDSFSSIISLFDNYLSPFGRRCIRPFYLLPGLIRGIFHLDDYKRESLTLGYTISFVKQHTPS